MGGILGGFFSLYSSFAEQCACYPYIFPTIFPRAAAGIRKEKIMHELLFFIIGCLLGCIVEIGRAHV